MKCNDFKEKISLYIDNKLSLKETEDLKKHLEICPECKQEYIVLKNIKNILSKVGKKEISSSFTDSVMDKIKSKSYEQQNNVVFINFVKKHFVMAAGFLFIVLSSSLFFVKDTYFINKKANNEYYASVSSAMQYYFDNNNLEDDTEESDYEEYILSLLV